MQRGRRLLTIALAGLFALPAYAESASPAGALDLELVEHDNGSFTLRDAAYEITFPDQPKVTGAPGEARAIASSGEDVVQIAFTVAGGTRVLDAKGIKAVLGDTRDATLAPSFWDGVAPKVLGEQPSTVGGIPGRRTRATGKMSGQALMMDLWVGWDVRHRTVLMLMTVSPDKTRSKAIRAFWASFKVKAGKGPPAT
jgi:hypothetical protein